MVYTGIAQVTGVKAVINELRSRDAQFAKGIERGLRKGGLYLQRVSQLQVPVETGQLKASAFTRSVGTGFQTKVTVGYTSFYALYVHEAVGMVLQGKPRQPNPPHKGRYWDPQGRAKAKFLEDPVRTEAAKITTIVRDEAFLSKFNF